MSKAYVIDLLYLLLNKPTKKLNECDNENKQHFLLIDSIYLIILITDETKSALFIYTGIKC